MKQRASSSIIVRPESHDDVRAEAKALLKAARVVGTYPTPVDALVQVASVQEVSDLSEARENFLATAVGDVRARFLSGWAKIRGFADIVMRVTYTAPDASEVRARWTRLHELGHQRLPWQNVRGAYQDDDVSLSASCEEVFDQEANDFASELLFQGDRFPAAGRHAGETMNAVFNLANKYGASRHATSRRFAEESREAALLITYYQSQYTSDRSGMPELRLGRNHSASAKFLASYSEMEIPKTLGADHPWAAARGSSLIHHGEIHMECGDGTTARFQWEAWWNQYRLLVMLWKPGGLRLVRLRS